MALINVVLLVGKLQLKKQLIIFTNVKKRSTIKKKRRDEMALLVHARGNPCLWFERLSECDNEICK